MVRKELSLVSSMAPEAIDPQRLHHPGSQMLYDLLQAARAEAQTVGPVEAAQAMGRKNLNLIGYYLISPNGSIQWG